MIFSFFLQLLINGAVAGSLYALISSGFSLIYNTSKFFNFSHGAVIMLASYFTYVFYNLLNIHFAVSAVLTLITITLFGVMTAELLYHPLRKKKSSNVILLISSIAVLMLIENIILLLFGAGAKSYLLFDFLHLFEFAGAVITSLEIVIVLAAALISISLYLLMKKTSIGKKLQAVSDNPELAESIGMHSSKIRTLAFALASFIAGIAGILIALQYNIYPASGTNFMIKGFAGAIIGGISSVHGSVLGAFLVGIIENLGAGFLPSYFKDAIAFFLLFIFLLFKPKGLFGGSQK